MEKRWISRLPPLLSQIQDQFVLSPRQLIMQAYLLQRHLPRRRLGLQSNHLFLCHPHSLGFHRLLAALLPRHQRLLQLIKPLHYQDLILETTMGTNNTMGISIIKMNKAKATIRMEVTFSQPVRRTKTIKVVNIKRIINSNM